MTTKHEKLVERLLAALEARGYKDVQQWLATKSPQEVRAIACAVGVK